MKSSDTLSNISINDKINKEMNLSENDFSILNENFFINQKKQIEILKRGIKNKELVEQDDNNLIDHKYLILFSTKLTLEFLFKWDYAEYDFDYQDGEEVPYIKSHWEFFPNVDHYPYNGIEITSKLLKPVAYFNMNSDAVEIDVTFRLYGESSFWLFSRISVKNCTFDEHSAIIKIHKMENSVKSFLSMGTLVNINNELKVKTFLRQQLINFNKKKDLKHLEQNFCQYRLLIIDGGEENIYCKVYLNDSTIENNIVGEFFLPYYSKSRILIGGTGDSCKLLNFSARPYNKIGSPHKFDIDRNNCECCIIW